MNAPSSPAPAPGPWPSRLAIGLLILAIRLYQVTLGPMLCAFGSPCRFHPSCSRYMIGSLRKHGLFKGLARGIARLLCCHPWHPGGYDPP